MYHIREANQMIEEFMLAANVSVAEKNLKAFSFVLDIKFGPDLDVSSSKALDDSLDRAVAVYFCSGDLTLPEFHHYGLASPLYTHFTSPIRRYVDVIVHKLLAAALGIYKLPPIFQDRPQLTSISDSKNLLCYATYINGQKKIRASWNITVIPFLL
ncbi:hypothetical protein IFM89_010928 [Coptis chinensis]|uniref:RNB domain-containing protein n=1 Tax=Coptis chinensis TaxID=261450 RepID=A0A835IP40_9MAGN|nr:hypothetical protein IFM89_010928 [Coptis chinensis]